MEHNKIWFQISPYNNKQKSYFANAVSPNLTPKQIPFLQKFVAYFENPSPPVTKFCEKQASMHYVT